VNVIDSTRPEDAAGVEAVVAAVDGFGAWRKRWSVFEGLAWFVLVGPGLLLGWFLLDWLIGLPAWPLLLALGVVVVLGLWAAARRLAPPLLRRVDTEREALLVESLCGGLGNQLIGSIQLSREVAEADEDGRPLGYSAALVHALARRAAAAIAGIDTRALLDLRRARRMLCGAVLIAVASASCGLFAPGAVAARVARVQDAWAAVLDALFPVELLVEPGDVAVVRARPVTLRVHVRGARRREVRLSRVDIETNQATDDVLELCEEKAELAIAAAEASFTYAFEYGGRHTARHTVLVGDLPTVSAINYELAYPTYTGQPPRTIVGRVDALEGLAGTDVLVSFAATTDLHPDYCTVEWQDGTKQAIAVSGRFGHFAFAVDRNDRATVRLTGAYGPGFEMERPLSFRIGVQRDEAPTVAVLLRKTKLTMLAQEAAAFGLRFVAEDDFGVQEVSVGYRIDTIDRLLGRPVRQGSQTRRLDPPRDRVRGTFAELLKDLSPPLEPGDRITLTVAAKDNNTETGPLLGRSRPVEIVIVRHDLAGFAEREFGFGGHELLSGLQRIKRATDLLVDPVKTIRTEARQEVARQALKSRVAHETWPSGSEDAVGDYFRLLSGIE